MRRRGKEKRKEVKEGRVNLASRSFIKVGAYALHAVFCFSGVIRFIFLGHRPFL